MKNKGIIFGIIASVTFISCGEDESGAWDKFKPLTEIDKHIAGYYDASLGQAANPKSGNPAVYVDFSDGLIQAYTGNPLNGQIVQAICNKMLSPEIEWYSLGGSKITKLEYNSNQLYNKVSDPKQYKDIMAPIQEALKKITASSNDALLITDFEEYTSNGIEQFENYPKTYFTEWLKKGNSITFFYTDYSETNKKLKNTVQKHLYYTVFTHGKATDNSLITMVKDALKGRYETKVFELNNTPYSVANNYGGKDNTGIVNKSLSQRVNYNLNAYAESKLPYEVIGINIPWDKKIDEDILQKIITKEDALFLNKLTMNAEDQKCFKLNKVAVKVYDVSADYEKYAQCNEVKNHLPVLTKNAKKEDVWDEKTSKDAIAKLCYNANSTVLKPEWTFSPTDLSTKLWKEIFDLNKSIFEGHLKNEPAKIELQTVFHANYKLKNITDANALLRVDYVIEDATFNDANAQLNDFQWMSTTMPGKTNSSLSESIRNTLQETAVNPKGKIIYSYYIKFGNTNKSEK